MKKYNNIMVAASLISGEDEQVIERVISLVGPDIKVYLIHVIDEVASLGNLLNYNVNDNLPDSKLAVMQCRMDELCSKYNLAKDCCLLKVGDINEVILETSKRLKIDLIVLGNHYSSLWNLYSSTTDQVLNDTSCDVLAVRIKQNKEVY